MQEVTNVDDLLTDLENEQESKTTKKDTVVKPKDKSQHIRNLMTSLVASAKEMDAIREAQKDVIKDYIDNDYLDKDDIKKARQAISLARKMMKLDDLEEFMKEATKLI